jgi:hypothetical protein
MEEFPRRSDFRGIDLGGGLQNTEIASAFFGVYRGEIPPTL